jgi:hypothetical protein
MHEKILFLDAEFTDMLNPELLSMAMVTRDGREFYAELDLKSPTGKARHAASSDFVKYGIFEFWGQVPGASCTALEMGRRAAEWLLMVAADTDSKLTMAFDYPMDYELLEYAIRDAGLWEQVRDVVVPLNINNVTGNITGELAAEHCYEQLCKPGGRGLHRHHALADALALRAAYIALNPRVQEAGDSN